MVKLKRTKIFVPFLDHPVDIMHSPILHGVGVNTKLYVTIFVTFKELDLVCRKQQSQTAAQHAGRLFLKFVGLFVFTRDSRPMPMM